MDDTTQEFNQVMAQVNRYSGSVMMVTLMSARLSFKLLTYLLRLAKKGMVSVGIADTFKNFTKKTEGNFTVYNIPLTEDRAQTMTKLNQLDLKLEKEKNPVKAASFRKEIKALQKEVPELDQLRHLNIDYCVLPKLNGSSQTIQVAVKKDDDQLFKNWYLNHLTTALSGGEMQMEEMRVFTEGNYSIFNLPMEGEELSAVLPDFDILGINYSILPDLKIGDDNSQIAIANADRSKFETWIRMWRDKQIKDGKEPGNVYEMNQDSYLNTGEETAESYIKESDPQYKEANQEFEEQSTEVPWTAALGKENSEEYVRLLQDDNFEKITINRETLVDNLTADAKTQEMQKNGYFISRVPGTYGQKEQTLILPSSQVFTADGGKTYIAFLPKNAPSMVADASGNIKSCSFEETYAPYDKVKRGFEKVKSLSEGKTLKQQPVAPSFSKNTKTPQAAAPTPALKL